MATQDPISNHALHSGCEAMMADRRGRRLSLSCRLFFWGGDDFEGEATVLDLSTSGCHAKSLVQVQVGMVLRLSLFLHDQQWPLRIDEALVRWSTAQTSVLSLRGSGRPNENESEPSL